MALNWGDLVNKKEPVLDTSSAKIITNGQPASLGLSATLRAGEPSQAEPKNNPFSGLNLNLQQNKSVPVKDGLVSSPKQDTVDSAPSANHGGIAASASLPVEMETKKSVGTDGVKVSTGGGAQIDQFKDVGFSLEQVKMFRENVEVLENSFEHKGMIANAIRNILLTTKQDPNYCKLLLPEDIGLMVKALRESVGLVASSKTFTKAKRARNSADIEEVKDLIGDIVSVGDVEDAVDIS